MLRLKCRFGDDIRRISLEDTTFEGLCLALLELYSFKTTHLTIKYLDDENELISITSTEELREADRISRDSGQPILRLVVGPADSEELDESFVWLRSSGLNSIQTKASGPPSLSVQLSVRAGSPPQQTDALGPKVPAPSPPPLAAPPISLTSQLQLLSASTVLETQQYSNSALQLASEASDRIRDAVLATKPLDLTPDIQQSLSVSVMLSSQILEDVTRLTKSTLALTQSLDQLNLEETDRLRRESRKECDELSNGIRDQLAALSASTRDDTLHQADLILQQIKSM
jgi:hypothetical protein